MTEHWRCEICERNINAAPGTSGVVLCLECASLPVLVAAFREGRVRLANELVDTTPP
jgi:hypothetical protein